MTPEIVVIGSVNLDRVVNAPKLPKPGETIIGGEFREFFGGKGANQAVASQRASGKALRTGFVGKVGTDVGGRDYVQHLRAEGLDLSFLTLEKDVLTGIALVVVGPDGENQIAVAPGANFQISLQDIEVVEEWIRGARILLVQLEVPLKAVLKAFQLARKAGVMTVLNPAPVPSGNELKELLGWTDLVISNRVEAEALAGQRIDSFDSVRQACDILCNKGPEAVVITLGDKGAMFSGSWGSGYIDAFAVEVQDTTGAGDAFCGALAVALAECRDLENAVRFAAAAAALACRVPGAQPSLPSRENIDKMLGVPDLIIKR